MGYLDQFGVEDARRERRVKRLVLTLIVVLGLGSFLYYWFKNYREERRAKEFLTALERGDYAAAYTYWGCRVDAPCPNYDYKSFLEDWGPASPSGKVSSARMVCSHECGSGVVVTVSLNNRPAILLWVEKKDGSLSFSPFRLYRFHVMPSPCVM